MTHPYCPDQGIQFAAPSPGADEPEEAALSGQDRDLDVLCERWVAWCATRRLYAPAPTYVSILGQLAGRRRPPRAGGMDAATSAELAAFHIAYLCQPDALDKQVFDLYYVHRVKPIKAAATALGISRKHFYSVLSEFRRRVHAAAQAVQGENETARDALPHYVPVSGA